MNAIKVFALAVALGAALILLSTSRGISLSQMGKSANSRLDTGTQHYEESQQETQPFAKRNPLTGRRNRNGISTDNIGRQPQSIASESEETYQEQQQPQVSKIKKVQQEPKEPTQQSAQSTSEAPWGTYPDWWTKAWDSSAVASQLDQYVGDEPFFPPCKTDGSGWKGYDFVEPPPSFLKNVTNPCWYENPQSKKTLSCAPYFYLAGVAKCGTTDIAKRLRLHPEVGQGSMKEYHWWERDRFGSFNEEDPESVKMDRGVTFKEYTAKITGRDIYSVQNEIKDTGSSRVVFGDFSPSYLWDPQNWVLLEGNQGCTEPRLVVGQHIHHFAPQAKILMIFRHPTPRLYSRFVSRIPRTAALRGATAEDFHEYVVNGVKLYNDCFKRWSIRQCAYNHTLYKDAVTRLVEGMYPVFMADWLRTWPREQMLLMRYEDYGGHEREHISKILKFIGRSDLARSEMDGLMKFHAVNQGTVEYAKSGSMFNSTKKILDEFYEPFVLKFAEMLKDRRFLWTDIPH